MNPRGVVFLGLAGALLSLAGCASRSHLTHQPERPSPVSVRPVASGSASNQATSVPTPPQSAPAPAIHQVAPAAPPPSPAPEPPAARVAAYLPAGCIVTRLSDRELVVKTSTPKRAPSLYEESIALSRLRGQLKSRPGLPTGTADQSSLKDGTATIVFTSPLPPAEVAGVISSALSQDTIQRVRVMLAAPDAAK